MNDHGSKVAERAILRDRIFTLIRKKLRKEGFIEFATPIIRQKDCGFRPRPHVELWEVRYLREAIGAALRYNLQYVERVFEIGPCFRFDDVDSIHLPEFYMMDLYCANAEFAYIKSLAKDLVGEAIGSEVQEYSVAAHLADDLRLDPETAPENELRRAVINKLRLRSNTHMYEAFEAYFDRELAPLSKGKALMFTNLPSGTEVCARKRPDTESTLNRFELFVDGIEIAHGYEDETDLAAFRDRASEIGFFNEEQERVMKLREAGVLPPSSGFAIGLERLCMARADDAKVMDFLFSREF